MEHNCKGEGRLRPPEKPLRDHEMAGTTHGKEFGDTLDKTQQGGLKIQGSCLLGADVVYILDYQGYVVGVVAHPFEVAQNIDEYHSRTGVAYTLI